jgi:mRNA interferase RelE/StbE
VKYSVFIVRSAQKSLDNIPSPFFAKITNKLFALAEDPRPPGCKKMEGEDKLWRIRVGNYRIVYEINDLVLIVTAIKIAHRRDIYR